MRQIAEEITAQAHKFAYAVNGVAQVFPIGTKLQITHLEAPASGGGVRSRGRRGTASLPQAAVVKATARAPSEASLLAK